MANSENRNSGAASPIDPSFKDRIESLSEIRYEVTVLLIDSLGLKAQSWLVGIEQANTLSDLRKAIFLVQGKLIKEGKQDVARELLALWQAKTGY